MPVELQVIVWPVAIVISVIIIVYFVVKIVQERERRNRK